MNHKSEMDRSILTLITGAITHLRFYKLAPYHGRDFTDDQLLNMGNELLDRLEQALYETPQSRKKPVGRSSGAAEDGCNPRRKKISQIVSEVR